MTVDLIFSLTEALIFGKIRDIGAAACYRIERKVPVPGEELDTYSLVAYALLLTDLEKREIVNMVLGKVGKDENESS